MNKNYRKIKRLFLTQSYIDSWSDYQRSLRKKSYIVWDYVILTASNEEQAEAYRQQIAYRLELGVLSERTSFVVLPDPDGKRVGSGGATFHVLKYIMEQDEPGTKDHFKGKRILVIHSGGDSKRVPQYSACGKLFSPVPRALPNGRPSTLFDEFMISMTAVAPRIPEGMLVLSGDVLLLFNPLQIDFQFRGAAAISMKENVQTGKNHGVFLNDGRDCVDRFLHKQTEEALRTMGAVNENDAVDLDTGAVVMDTELLNALSELISTENQVDVGKFDEFVNERARISFYGDFLYPLAKKSTLEDYYEEAPEGSFSKELHDCRTKIWEKLHTFNMKLLCLSPAEFIHFGTTKELLELVTAGVDDYEYLDWKKLIMTNRAYDGSYAVNNSLIEDGCVLQEGSYVEDCRLGGEVSVGAGSVLSNLKLTKGQIPEKVVLHGLRMKQKKYVARIYGILDNPKGTLAQKASFLNTTIPCFLLKNSLKPEDIWDDKEQYLWFARLYPVCDSYEKAVEWAFLIYKMAEGKASQEEIEDWKKEERVSLYSSFNQADVKAIVPWKQELENEILVENFIGKIRENVSYEEALAVFGQAGVNEIQFRLLLKRAKGCDFSTRIRILYDISRYMKKNHRVFDETMYDALENDCFAEIQGAVCQTAGKDASVWKNYRIVKEEVNVALPARVNWGGGWTDTPPYCLEHGGVVLNAAILLKGIAPVRVTIRRIQNPWIEFESADIEVEGKAETMQEIRDCHNPYDFFALHKAALIACGIIPMEGKESLQDILTRLGGGFYLSTQVEGIPKGSGLGTSSILSGACVKAIYEFLGKPLSDGELYELVLCMEQIMSTGGGWQDQVGGLTPGIKLITTKPGVEQKICVDTLTVSNETKQELSKRFVLIYTGQRRLARNLLRDVIGNYIGGRRESIQALEEMQSVAALMRFELERGKVDEFAKLLNQHWELSKQLDAGSTNTCIDQIFFAIEDLIDGRFIAGAGGGGFLQVIMKKNVTKEQLQSRLYEVFQESGVTVWDTQFVWDSEGE